MKIYSISSVSVTKISKSPIALYIQVSGIVASTNWNNGRLDNSSDPNPVDSIFEFSFEADRTTSIGLPVLTAIQANLTMEPKTNVDAIIVTSRTNSITVHSSEFVDFDSNAGQLTTLVLGEESPMKMVTSEDRMAALNNFRKPTTLAIGEEGQYPTLKYGEHNFPTLEYGENGPITDIRVEDFGPYRIPPKWPLTGPRGEAGPDPFPDYRDRYTNSGPFGNYGDFNNSKY